MVEKKKEEKEKVKVKLPADGTVVRGSDGTVYVIEAGKKRAIPDFFTYVRMGISADYVIQTKDEELEAIPDGVPMPKLSPKRKKGKR